MTPSALLARSRGGYGDVYPRVVNEIDLGREEFGEVYGVLTAEAIRGRPGAAHGQLAGCSPYEPNTLVVKSTALTEIVRVQGGTR